MGTPGTGKTHLAISIGIESAKNRYQTYFINCNELILQLKKAKLENTLARRLKHFTSYSVLIIDEVGFLPINAEDSNLLFQLISMRYKNIQLFLQPTKVLVIGVKYLEIALLQMQCWIQFYIIQKFFKL